MGTYPYVASGGPLIAAISQLRRSFPSAVTSDTLQKLSIAPNNESYVINVLRFLGYIDTEGKKVADAVKHFLAADSDFQAGMAKSVQAAYHGLFEIHADAAWTVDKTKLVAFFRTSDESGEIVGQRQATTFQTLATLAGKRPAESGGTQSAKPAPVKKVVRGSGASPAPKPSDIMRGHSESGARQHTNMGLNVRIELNLPATDDPKVYDAIFKSIRENLLRAEQD